MKKVAIFMSDFHLGQKDKLEEFFADEEFAELLGRLSRHHQDNQVDLVLLGDVIDLWTTSLDPAEQHAETAEEIKLHFPAQTEKQIEDAVKAETAKVEAITKAHPLFFETLGLFLADAPDRRTIAYVPGNHDHSMVHSALQDVIRESILTERVKKRLSTDIDLKARITFTNFHNDPFLQVYAEHGNQFTFGGTFKYDDFGRFGEECPGYFQFKLVSNRLERKNPEIDGVFMEAFEPAMWPGIVLWLLMKGHPRLYWAIGDFQTQYQQDERDGVKNARKKLQPAWKSIYHLIKSRWVGLTGDEFSAALPKLFDKSQTTVLPLSGKHLDPLTTKTVILGHSHQRREVPLRGLEGVTYYNTGGWIMRVENGRRVVEQTWVTVSRDVDEDACRGGRVIIDRESVNRRVQRAKRSQQPVTTDGRVLNPTLREMTDLRVGDVVLFRGNYGAMIRRLLKECRVWQLIGAVPDMLAGWLNRKGTNSPWNHAALVYASPSEREEADSYNDPLFLESIPGTGVGIHGPQHYLEHPTDWDVAILRLKASWLAAPIESWRNRRLLRRMALSALQTHYDTHKIRGQTVSEAARSLDQRGKSYVGGLAKGAFGGFLAGVFLLVSRGVYEIMASRDPNQGWTERTAFWLVELRNTAITFFDDTKLVPFVNWTQVEDIFTKSSSALFHSAGIAAWMAATIYTALAVAGMLAVVGFIWFASTVVYGAGLGVLIVPPLAELSRGWSNRSPVTRWFVTVIWITFYILMPLFIWYVFAGHFEELKNDVGRDAALWAGLELFLAIWLAGTATIILLTPILIWLVDSIVQKIQQMVLGPWRQIMSWIQNRKPGGGRRLREDKQFIVAPQFVCSTLVQYALIRTAELVKQSEGVNATDDVDILPVWQDYLPKHFAQSDKFKWIYLLVDGKLIHRPSVPVQIQASPRLADSDVPRELSGSAWGAATLAAFAACLMLVADGAKLMLCGGKLLTCQNGHNAAIVWGLLGGGTCLALIAFAFTRLAFRRLALRPKVLQGRVLAAWGSIWVVLALIGSIPIMFHARSIQPDMSSHPRSGQEYSVMASTPHYDR